MTSASARPKAFQDAIVARMGNDENPAFEADTTKPEPYTAVLLYFADGSRKGGIWTERVWWSEGHSVEPQRWQRMPAPQREQPSE